MKDFHSTGEPKPTEHLIRSKKHIRRPCLLAFFLLTVIFSIASRSVFAQDTPGSKKSDDPTRETGIDPTDIRTRIEGAYTYNERSNGVTRHHINTRLEREFKGRGMNLRLDVPISYADIPDGSSQGGLGDVSVRLNYRYTNTPGYSALAAGTIRLDTASDDTLGNATTMLGGNWVHSWRRQAWLLSAAVTGTWSASGEHDSAGLVPVVAYQPMKKYLSYVNLGMPIIYNIDDGTTSAITSIRFGKTFSRGRVLYIGTRYDLTGNADDALIVTIGYRHLF